MDVQDILSREAGLIHICKEVIQRNKAVVPGGEKTQRVWRKSGTFIHASASHYFMYWYKSILCFLRDGGSEWILTALATLRGGFLYFLFIFQFTCTHYLIIHPKMLVFPLWHPFLSVRIDVFFQICKDIQLYSI